MVDLTELRATEEEARALYARVESSYWEAAYGGKDSPPLFTLLTHKHEALDAYRTAVERRQATQTAERLYVLYADEVLLESARAAQAEIDARVSPTPRSEMKRS